MLIQTDGLMPVTSILGMKIGIGNILELKYTDILLHVLNIGSVTYAKSHIIQTVRQTVSTIF